MATKTFKIGLSNQDKQNMAQDVYERVLALTFNEYDTTTEYKVGDFVVYNDQLYKCIGATSGAWDNTKWQLATLNDLVTDIENAVAFVNDKANVNGNYPTMTVGFADNITPYDESAGDDQDEPFSFQATGTGNGTQPDFSTGSGALMKEKQGNTVAVNQLVDNGNFATSSYWSVGYNCSSLSIANGVAEFVAAGSYAQIASRANANVVQGHKYLCSVEAKASRAIMVGCGTTSTSFSYTTVATDKYTNCIAIKEALSNATGVSCFVVSSNAQQNDVIYCKNVIFIDLTQWFNGDIPQDILDNPSNFFRYYQGSLAYNGGTLVNADGRYIKCIGRQQWDGEVANGFYDTTTGEFTSNNSYRCSKNKIRVNPNSDVYIYADDTVIVQQYDANGNMITGWSLSGNGNWASIGDNHFKVQPNCSYITWWKSTTDNIQVTVSIYYEGETGYRQHYPYQVLTNNDTGNEVLRSAGSVKDYKTPDGTIHRKIGYVDLGTLTWTYHAASGNYGDFFDCYLPNNCKVGDSAIISNIICGKGYKAIASGNIAEIGYRDKVMAVAQSSTRFIVCDLSYTDAATFKTAMNGVYLNYELAEETTEQGTPYSENLVIDDFGSMDFDSDVPQGALIFYPVDYKAFVDTLYKYTDGTPSNVALKSDLVGLVPQEDLSDQITNKNANLTFSVASLIKQGRVHTLTVVADTNGNLSQGDALFTLPSGAFISGATYWDFALIRNTSTGVNTQESIFISNADGGVKIGNNLASGNRICLSLSYIV